MNWFRLIPFIIFCRIVLLLNSFVIKNKTISAKNIFKNPAKKARFCHTYGKEYNVNPGMVTGALVLALANTPFTNFSAPKKTISSNAA
jgi:hypothetical protein